MIYEKAEAGAVVNAAKGEDQVGDGDKGNKAENLPGGRWVPRYAVGAGCLTPFRGNKAGSEQPQTS